MSNTPTRYSPIVSNLECEWCEDGKLAVVEIYLDGNPALDESVGWVPVCAFHAQDARAQGYTTPAPTDARIAHDAIARLMQASGQTFQEVVDEIRDMAELGLLDQVAVPTCDHGREIGVHGWADCVECDLDATEQAIREDGMDDPENLRFLAERMEARFLAERKEAGK